MVSNEDLYAFLLELASISLLFMCDRSDIYFLEKDYVRSSYLVFSVDRCLFLLRQRVLALPVVAKYGFHEIFLFENCQESLFHYPLLEDMLHLL